MKKKKLKKQQLSATELKELKAKNRKKSNSNLKTWKKGQSGNPKGRPKGLRNYRTVFNEAVRKIAKGDTNITPDSIESLIISNAIKNASKGNNFNYYKDIIDRLFGTAVQKQEVSLTSLEIKDEDKKKINNIIDDIV